MVFNEQEQKWYFSDQDTIKAQEVNLDLVPLFVNDDKWSKQDKLFIIKIIFLTFLTNKRKRLREKLIRFYLLLLWLTEFLKNSLTT